MLQNIQLLLTILSCERDDIDPVSGRLMDAEIERICIKLEVVRSQSIAVRNLNLFSKLQGHIEQIGGSIIGVGINRAVYIRLAGDKDVVVYPTVGVPTSTTLHDATKNSPDCSVAVVFDHVGLHPNWLEHLDWLGREIQSAHWVKADEAHWQFAEWEV